MLRCVWQEGGGLYNQGSLTLTQGAVLVGNTDDNLFNPNFRPSSGSEPGWALYVPPAPLGHYIEAPLDCTARLCSEDYVGDMAARWCGWEYCPPYPCPVQPPGCSEAQILVESHSGCGDGQIAAVAGMNLTKHVEFLSRVQGSITDTVPPECPAGFYGNSTSIDDQKTKRCSGPCPAGYVCPSAGTVRPLPTPPGSYSGDGNRQPQICPLGHYCLGATSAPEQCPAGTLGNLLGLDSPACNGPCPEYHYCPAGSAAPIVCEDGTFGNGTGLKMSRECTTCADGSWCTRGQAFASSECTPEYTPATLATRTFDTTPLIIGVIALTLAAALAFAAYVYGKRVGKRGKTTGAVALLSSQELDLPPARPLVATPLSGQSESAQESIFTRPFVPTPIHGVPEQELAVTGQL